MSKSGIYAIVNEANSKFYIGSAKAKMSKAHRERYDKTMVNDNA